MVEIGLINGGTKIGEYSKTVEMLVDMTGSTKEKIMRILYFLYDSSYEGKDLRDMANLLNEKIRLKNKYGSD